MYKYVVVIISLSTVLFSERDLSDFRNQRFEIMNPAPRGSVLYGPTRVWDSRAVLYSAIPDTINASNMVCQLDSVYPFEADVTDDINPANYWNVDTVISWWWCWSGFMTWTLVPNIHMVMYDDNSGQPADDPYQEVVIEQGNYAVFEYVTDERWRLECYTSGVLNIDPGLQWFEIQPSNVFTVNGMTGIVGEPGIGNSQEAYFRSQVLGYPNWVTASTVFGSPNEAGFVILGTTGGGPTHDVGCVAITSPPSQVFPNSCYDCEALIRNFGSSDETFPVEFMIDSSGTIVYQETIDSVFLAVGQDTVITLPPWTAPQNAGLIYTVACWTALPNDENPSNDTAYATITTVTHFWEVLNPPEIPHASSGHSCAATNDTSYWMMNIQTTSGFIPDCDLYNINTNTWTPSATVNPFGAGSYGTANAVNGKIYCIGGTVSWPNPLRRVHIYDPVNDQWTQGADAPTGLLDHAAAVYMNRYIITFGNGNWAITPTNEVYVYDTELDTWSTGTTFPGTARGAAAFAVVDWWSWEKYAVGACGYKQDGTYGNDYIVGIIDTDDPTQITWGNWQTIPGMTTGRYRVPYTQDGWWLWLINGQYGPYNDVWTYDPNGDFWYDWECPKPTPMANVAPLALIYLPNYWQIFVPGGYNGIFLNSHEKFSNLWGGTEEQPSRHLPTALLINPLINPVKSPVPITFSNNLLSSIQFKIYDSAGRIVRTIIDGRAIPPGTKTVFWNGRDDKGQSVPSGVYFLRLQAGDQVTTKKIVYLK